MNIHLACVVCSSNDVDAKAVAEFAANKMPQEHWSVAGQIPIDILSAVPLKDCCCSPESQPDRYWLLTAAEVADPLLHDPGNKLGRIDSLYAFLSVDEGGEGICAARFGGTQMPLVTSNPNMLDKMRRVAADIANLAGKPVRLVKFVRSENGPVKTFVALMAMGLKFIGYGPDSIALVDWLL